MSNIWFPVPVALFFRRVVNVLSTLSITHHYLLPRRSTSAEKHGPEFQSQRADRVLLGDGQSDADRYVLWTTIVENSLDDILQASGKLSIPWFRWPARLSPFHSASRSDNYMQHPNDQTSTEKNAPSSDPGSWPRPQGPPEPADPSREDRESLDEIHRLMQNPVLYDPLRAPRYPIVLCHGLYGFDVRAPSSFPSLRMNYWSSILNILRKTVGAEVIVTAVPGTGSITSRAEQLDRFLKIKALGRGINFMAHSMGGLDCRYLITHLKPVDYTPLSLTTIGTPHRGSPFMDWCKEYLGLGRRRHGEEEKRVPGAVTAASVATMGLGKETSISASPRYPTPLSPSPGSSFSSLPSSFTTYLLGMFDSPAYANLTTTYLTEIFNPRTPDDPRVRYFSVAGRAGPLNIWHPLWLPKLILNGADGGEGNDGLVSVDSARWGEFLGIVEGGDHWALRGASGIELDVDLPSVVNDSWSLGDWGRIVRALRRVERQESGLEGKEKAAQASEEGLKSSTDRLSAVFDWLVEQVPVVTRNGFTFAGEGDSRGGSGAGGGARDGNETDATGMKARALVTPQKARRLDLESKRDLERLYVSLARKLYDEGL